MNKLKIILTGATGMVGEGVLLHCLQAEEVEKVLVVGRRHFDYKHPKLEELIVPDFNQLDASDHNLQDCDACFFCAGISSVGMNEEDYTKITYTTTLNFAQALHKINPNMVFNYVSGGNTDSQGKQMWQRVKGKTEDDLMKIGFKGQHNFRPGFMKPVSGQKNVKWFFKPVIAVFPLIAPSQSLTLHQVGQAMINTAKEKDVKAILEIPDIRNLAAQS